MGSLIDYVDTSSKKYTKIDEINANTWIVGYTNAAYTVPTSSPFWAIQRISKSGNTVTVEWANSGAYDRTWDDRLSYFSAASFSNTLSTYFDGVNDYCRVSSASLAAFTRTSPFSVSMWIRPLALTSGMQIISLMPSTASQGWSIYTSGTGKLIWNMLVANTTNEIEVVTTNQVLNIGQWVHVVVTYSGSGAASGVNIYINDGGAPVALTTTVDNLVSNPGYSTFLLTLGANAAVSPGSFFHGDIDEVSIHSVALSGAEVTTLYNSGEPLDLSGFAGYSNVVAWWRMGDNDAFPVIADIKDGVNADMQMYGSTPANITGAVP